jgi:hypothetical protein
VPGKMSKSVVNCDELIIIRIMLSSEGDLLLSRFSQLF